MKILLGKRDKILPHLYDWLETFNSENIMFSKNIDEDKIEEMDQDYEYLLNLFTKFEKGNCSEDDYQKILFHIHQINYNKTIIDINE